MSLFEILAKFIDADKLGGWVRAGVASLLTIAIAHWAPLGSILTPETQTSLGVVVAGIVVGIWSQLTKSDAAKMQMAAEVPSSPAVDKAKVEMTNALPSVAGVITTPTLEGKALAQSVPAASVAVAGTQAAAQVAEK